MTSRFIVQPSGAMFESGMPNPWCFVFGLFITDEDGAPVKSLTKQNFSVWELTQMGGVGELKVQVLDELNAAFPQAHMPGIYRVETVGILGFEAGFPQEFVCAIRVAQTKEKTPREGMTTVPITFLGPPHP